MTETKELPKEAKVEDIKKSADEKGCPVQKALYYITEFLAGPMCARCFPCSMGSYEARTRLRSLADGTGSESDINALKRIADDMLEASMCKKGKDTARFIIDWLATGVFHSHVEGSCPDGVCKSFVEYRIIAKQCSICGLCKDVCKHGAVLGEKSKPYSGGYPPFEIRQKRCVKCGECIKVCPVGAIITAEAFAKEPAGV